MPFNSANMASNQGYSNNTYRKFSPTNANFNRNGNNFNKNRNQQRSPQFDKLHHQQNQKKQKVDKRDLPENNQFYCEVCDRGFKTDEKYAEHCATHKTVFSLRSFEITINFVPCFYYLLNQVLGKRLQVHCSCQIS